MENLPIPNPTMVVRAASSRGDDVKANELLVPPTLGPPPPGGLKGLFREAVFS